MVTKSIGNRKESNAAIKSRASPFVQVSARRPGHNHIKHGGQTSTKTTYLSRFHFRTLIDLQTEDRDAGHLYLQGTLSSDNLCMKTCRFVVLREKKNVKFKGISRWLFQEKLQNMLCM